MLITNADVFVFSSPTAKNMDPLIYREFITELAQKLQGKGVMQ